MAKRFILLSDDLKSAKGKNYQHSLGIRALAINLSERLKEPLQLVFVDSSSPDDNSLKKITTEKIQSWKQRYDKVFFRMKSFFPENTEFTLKSGSASHEILEIIHSQNRPELVVMGTRGIKGLKKLFLGSVAEEVLRNSPRPVVVVGPAAIDKAIKFEKIKTLKILLLTDLSKTSRGAEEYAMSFAKRTGAKLTLCHSVGDQIQQLKTNIYSSGYVPFNLDETLMTVCDDAEASLEKRRRFIASKGIAVESRLILKENALSLSVSDELKKGYDLIIMGTHSRNAVMSTLLGSSARHTLLTSSVPVMIIKSN